ncbi:MAG TPA: DUF2905 domain-containing protein [Spirochaetota bacterium]|nr:DUF2905 domain-containing protein [Spirochaetota bacterium]HOM09652.1 DUF2905 domain-containing protein [Spirochaetota bacterium]HPP50421.1 DUF2905 domain-containing protein [Spirochaetota bacterium]
MGRLLILAGILLILTGILFQVFPKFLGKLPGDVMYSKGNMTVYFPFMTMLIISIILTLLVNVFLRFFK